MKLLLDSHSFLWFVGGDDTRLSQEARNLIEDGTNDAFLSIASVWEMAIKNSLGRLQLKQPFDAFMTQQITLNNFQLLHITINHTLEVVTLPFHHRDPFDRLLVAQSQIERMPIVSCDSTLDLYGIARLW